MLALICWTAISSFKFNFFTTVYSKEVSRLFPTIPTITMKTPKNPSGVGIWSPRKRQPPNRVKRTSPAWVASTTANCWWLCFTKLVASKKSMVAMTPENTARSRIGAFVHLMASLHLLLQRRIRVTKSTGLVQSMIKLLSTRLSARLKQPSWAN